MSLPRFLRVRRTPLAAAWVAILHVALVAPLSELLGPWMLGIGIMVGLVLLARIGWVEGRLPWFYLPVLVCHLLEPSGAIGFLPWLYPLALLLAADRLRNWREGIAWGLWMGFLIATGVYAWIWHGSVVYFEGSYPSMVWFFLLVSVLISLTIPVFLSLCRLLHDGLGWPLGLTGILCFSLVGYWYPFPFGLDVFATMTGWTLLLQPADLLGVHGLAFLVMLPAGLGHAAWELHRRGAAFPRPLLPLGAGVLILLTHLAYGWWAMKEHAAGGGADAIRVAMIQPVAPLKIMNRDVELRRETAEVNRDLSLRAIEASTRPVDLLLWPEGAGPFAAATPAFNPEFMEAVRDIQQQRPVMMAVQCIEFIRDEATGDLRYHNVVSTLNRRGEVEGTYRKNILLPFGEYLPLEGWFPFLRRLFPEARTILAGEEAEPLATTSGSFAPLICYEVLFPGHARKLAAQGPGYFVNFTNDRWYGERQQPIQHLAFARIRAIEHRLPVIRTTNSGISAFIDARGVLSPPGGTAVGERAALSGEVRPGSGRTFYGRHGDLLHPFLLTPVLLASLAYVCILKRRRLKAFAGTGGRSVRRPR